MYHQNSKFYYKLNTKHCYFYNYTGKKIQIILVLTIVYILHKWIINIDKTI